MLRLRKLRVRGFRGILNDAELDFGKKCQSLIVVGHNGTGKSSLVDAVEWLLTGRVEHLNREGCGDRAYRHRLLPRGELAKVEITTDNPQVSGSRTLDNARRAAFDSQSGSLAEFVNQARRDTVILRYAQMCDFVDKTKNEKLRYLADILGLGALSQLRDELRTTANRLKRHEDYRYLVSQIWEYEKRLKDAVAPKKFTATSVIVWAECLRQRLGGRMPISDVTSLQASVDELLAYSQRDEQTRQVMTLRQHLSDLEPLLDYETPLRQLRDLARDVTALRTDKAVVDQIALAELYRAGQEVIERQIGDTRLCPLCGQQAERKAIMDHLCQQLEAVGEIRSRLDELDARRRSLTERLREWYAWLTKVRVMATTLPEGEQLRQAAEDLLQSVRQWGENLASEDDPLCPPPEPSPKEYEVARTFARAHQEAFAVIMHRLGDLEGSVEQKAYCDQLEQLDRLRRDFIAWHRALKHKLYFDRQITTMEAVCARCERLERKTLEQVLATISNDVNRYYLRLHPGEGFDKIRLGLTTTRGVEFQFSYHGELISPPGQLMSESHLNTLGVCLFLASARQFNQHTRFLILDDIVNSVDAGHRSPLARLLRDEFEDFQLVLLTHDRLWFDILRRTATNWHTLEISSWSYTEGLQFKRRSDDLEEEARRHLENRDLQVAGNIARQWLERVLKERCLDLEVPVPFRYNDRNEERMPGELLPALRKHIEPTQIYTDNATLFQDLEASQFIGSRLSHDNVYLSGPPQAIDVELLLRDVRRLDNLFLCPKCNNYIAAKHTPQTAARKRCKCGELKLL